MRNEKPSQWCARIFSVLRINLSEIFEIILRKIVTFRFANFSISERLHYDSITFNSLIKMSIISHRKC